MRDPMAAGQNLNPFRAGRQESFPTEDVLLAGVLILALAASTFGGHAKLASSATAAPAHSPTLISDCSSGQFPGGR